MFRAVCLVVAIDPANAAHVLVGAAHGGVWESFGLGASWAPRTDYAATLTVGAIVFDPRNPSTVYCGTGEGNWWAYLGAGVLRPPTVALPGLRCVQHPLSGRASTRSSLTLPMAAIYWLDH